MPGGMGKQIRRGPRYSGGRNSFGEEGRRQAAAGDMGEVGGVGGGDEAGVLLLVVGFGEGEPGSDFGAFTEVAGGGLNGEGEVDAGADGEDGAHGVSAGARGAQDGEHVVN